MQCPAGRYSPSPGAANSSGCLACPTGTYSDLGWERCNAPGAGMYIITLGARAQCPPGKFAPAPGAADISGCLACDAGLFSEPGYDRCYVPGPGWFASNQGLRERCPAGRFVPAPGAANISGCLPCESGLYSEAGYDRCYSVGGGHFPGLNGLREACPVGTFAPAPGASSISGCLPCPSNMFSERGFERCHPPGGGWYIHAPGMRAACPTARYSIPPGAANFSGCLPCAPGTASGPGYDSCIPCNLGTLTGPLMGVTSASCPYTAATCPAGTYASPPICAFCPLGTWSATQGASACTACGVGTTTATPGAVAAAL
jgi:hypothetical protein